MHGNASSGSGFGQIQWLSSSTGHVVDNLFAGAHCSRWVEALGGNGKLWTGGWGDLDLLQHLSRTHLRRRGPARAGSLYPVKTSNGLLDIDWRMVKQNNTGEILWEGEFQTPVQDGSLPTASLTARCQLITPRGHSSPQTGGSAPVWIHLAGTGDQGFSMRQMLGLPLAREGTASLILESPFYGRRRPQTQRGPKLQHVSDLLSLGNATIEESLALMRWLNASNYGPLGVCGFSMGGVHAMMVAGCWEGEAAMVSMLAPHSAAPVFCRGALSKACDWRTLESTRPSVERVSSWWKAAGLGSMPHDGGWGAASCEGVQRLLYDVLSVTDVRLLPAPRNPRATIIVQATQDAYVDPITSSLLLSAWSLPESQLRLVPGGHVTSFLAHRPSFRAALRDAMAQMRPPRDSPAPSRKSA